MQVARQLPNLKRKHAVLVVGYTGLQFAAEAGKKMQLGSHFQQVRRVRNE